MIDKKVVGVDRAPREIGDQPQRGGGDHHRNDREAIEAVGQVDRIAERDDHEWTEQQERPAEIEDVTADKRKRERRRARGATRIIA